jgi:hypothetical protein
MYRDNLFGFKEATTNLTKTVSCNELACLTNDMSANISNNYTKKYVSEYAVYSNAQQIQANPSARVVQYTPLLSNLTRVVYNSSRCIMAFRLTLHKQTEFKA